MAMDLGTSLSCNKVPGTHCGPVAHERDLPHTKWISRMPLIGEAALREVSSAFASSVARHHVEVAGGDVKGGGSFKTHAVVLVETGGIGRVEVEHAEEAVRRTQRQHQFGS